jgi:ribosomal-protein-alanine N-acetyltransferase
MRSSLETTCTGTLGPVELFHTERLAVRPKTAADAAALDAIRGHELTDAHIRHQAEHGFSMWAVVDRATGEVIGDCGFLVDDDGVEIGWHLRADRRGQGLGTEIATAALRHGFEVHAFRQVSAYVERDNAASVRIVEKLGMRAVREGDEPRPWAEYQCAT